MHQRLRARAGRAFAALCLGAASMLSGAQLAGAVEMDEPVLRVGTRQTLDAMNPFQTELEVGYEVFALNYELLVGYDHDLQPASSFAEAWESNEAGDEWTFTIPEGKRWSDGESATAEDVVWTYELMLEAVASEAGGTCLGDLDPYLTGPGVRSLEAPDPQTVVITLDRPNERILQAYIPILPRHVWEEHTVDTFCDDRNTPPVVGSGPYQAQEWQAGQFVRFVRNPTWTHGDLAAEEVFLQFFETEDTMFQAIRNGELDYAQGLLSEQFDQLQDVEGIETVAASANGFTELGFNTYGTGTGNTIDHGGPSTPALLDPAFRDALGYAVDKEALVDRVVGGYGEPGDSHVPPFQATWYRTPENLRTFDLEEAARRLDVAGYPLEGDQRLDKEGNPIVLDLVFPDSDTTYASSAEFIRAWFGEVGIQLTARQYDPDTLVEVMLPPEAGGTADYDVFIWGWDGNLDPTSLLRIFLCEEIGRSSDSLYCNERYDELFELQNHAPTTEERKSHVGEMQDLIYAEAPYHVLYYDPALHAYRSDRFVGWENDADDGTPLFGYGPYGYTTLELASEAEPSPSSAATGEPAPSGSPASGPAVSGPTEATPAPIGGGADAPVAGGGDNTPLIVGATVLLAVVVLGGFFLMRRRGPGVEEE